MTLSPAYIDGFTKTAAVFKYNPVDLVRNTDFHGLLARYRELLKGSNPKLLPYHTQHALMSSAAGAMDALGARDNALKMKGEQIRYAIRTLLGKGPATDELRKVYATRAATGAMAVGALHALSPKPDREDKQNT